MRDEELGRVASPPSHPASPPSHPASPEPLSGLGPSGGCLSRKRSVCQTCDGMGFLRTVSSYGQGSNRQWHHSQHPCPSCTRPASATEARSAETRSGSAEGEGAAREAGDAKSQSPSQSSPPAGEDDLVQRLWQELVEKDDRTSPEEYPEMALITFDEFADYAREIAAEGVFGFAQAILHGDDEHRAWLIARSARFP